MILLDTDTYTLVVRRDSEEGLRVRARIAQVPPGELVATTIITYHEQCKGWIDYVAGARGQADQVEAYGFLANHLEAFGKARVIPYNVAAADKFEELRKTHRRAGTMDLRIAAIALTRRALLVTRNLGHFSGIEGLRAEDWTRIQPLL